MSKLGFEGWSGLSWLGRVYGAQKPAWTKAQRARNSMLFMGDKRKSVLLEWKLKTKKGTALAREVWGDGVMVCSLLWLAAELTVSYYCCPLSLRDWVQNSYLHLIGFSKYVQQGKLNALSYHERWNHNLMYK